MKKELTQRSMRVTNSQLRQHNTLLRKNLRWVVTCSADNETTQSRIDKMDDLVFSSPSLKVMFDTLIIHGRRTFELTAITVLLADDLECHYPEDYKRGDKKVFMESGNVMFVNRQCLAALFPDGHAPVLRGCLKEGDRTFFPNGLSRKIHSEAIAALSYGDRLSGAIGFGSVETNRFMEEYGSRFIKRLARTLSLKVEIFRANADPDSA